VLPAGPVHPPPAAAEHRVIDGHAQISARLGHQQDRQLRDRQAELVRFPAGPGEEVVRQVMRPGMLQAAAHAERDSGRAGRAAVRRPGASQSVRTALRRRLAEPGAGTAGPAAPKSSRRG